MDIDKKSEEYFMGIVQMATKLNTWDDIAKCFRPYLQEVKTRIRNHDKDIIKDFYILELFSSKFWNEYETNYERLENYCHTDEASYGRVFDAVVKLHRNKYKLDAVLEAQTHLQEDAKVIREYWEKQDNPLTKLDYGMRKQYREDWLKCHNIEIEEHQDDEDDENFVVEDSQMEEYFKAKCVELSNLRARMRVNEDLLLKMCQVMWLMTHVYAAIQREQIFDRASESEHDQYRKLMTDMWSNEVDIKDSFNDDNLAISKDTTG